MPDLNTTRAELEQYFITNWGITTPIAHDNSNYHQDQGETFVKVQIEFADSSNVCIGAAITSTERQRHSGIMITRIYVPLNEGSGVAYTLADTYKGIMDNKEIVSNLFTGASNVRRSGEQIDGFWSLICFTDFTSDE